MIGMDRFGASAPAQVIYEHLGFTVDNIVLRVLAVIDKSKR
jgi:transketolase